MSNKLTIDAGLFPDTISISDLLQFVKSSDGRIYLQSAFAGSRVDYDKPSLEAIVSGYDEKINISEERKSGRLLFDCQ